MTIATVRAGIKRLAAPTGAAARIAKLTDQELLARADQLRCALRAHVKTSAANGHATDPRDARLLARADALLARLSGADLA